MLARRARRGRAVRAPGTVARPAPHGTHDDRARAHARRRAAVRTGWSARCWSQPALRHAPRDLALHLPPRGDRHRRHPRCLPADQCLRRDRGRPHRQVQPRDQDRPRHLLFAAPGLFGPKFPRARPLYHEA